MILGYLKRWWHCLWRWHRGKTWYGFDGKTLMVDCECGRLFWKRYPDV